MNLKTRLDQKILTPDEAYAKMFGGVTGPTPEGNIIHLPLSDLEEYPEEQHPFKPYPEQDLQELAQNIAQVGVLSPIIVRPMAPTALHPFQHYQILAGHNRVRACRLIPGRETIPAIVKEVDDALANVIVSATNLNHRKKLLPSEKAFGYKMQMEGLKLLSDSNSDLNSSKNLNSTATVAELNQTSVAQIKRYIRLTYLIKPLLEMVDEDKLPFMAGVAVSYLSADEQDMLYVLLVQKRKCLSVSRAESIKEYRSAMGELSLADLERFLQPQEQEKDSDTMITPTIRLSKSHLVQICSYLPSDIKPDEAPEIIIEALKLWASQRGKTDETV